jgi:predicted dehydrogenase/glycine/D-amino acid oxidase-like deaminating enzyme
MKPHTPRILLLGAGAFGSKHLKTLLELQGRNLLSLKGVVVNTERSKALVTEGLKSLKGGKDVQVHRGFSEKLLTGIDGVDIVTPVDTHADLVRACLPHAHVLVEKPITPTARQASALEKFAKRQKHSLMVGHIFRYHPVVIRLKKIIEDIGDRPHRIEATFFNPINTDNGRDPEMEMLHPFDVIDYLFGVDYTDKHVDDRGRLHIVSLKYKGGMSAVLKLGWAGAERGRLFRIAFNDKHVVADFDKNTISIHQHGKIIETIDCSKGASPLEAELKSFLDLINKGGRPSSAKRGAGARSVDEIWPGETVGRRMVEIATAKRQNDRHPVNRKKKVAIIGAGIFGTNCAIELSSEYDVTLFEKNDDILSEASHINQYRIHWGYHYPRSQETVDDIKQALGDFELRYGDAIIREFPTYYSVAKEGSKVTAEEYLAFCDRNRLPYTIETPADEFLDGNKISLCLKTFEPIYSYDRLKKITSELLKKHKVKLRLNAAVVDAKILSDGTKKLIIKDKKGRRAEEFDYVINVTYARYNAFVKWLGFAPKPIRLDLVETLWIKLDIPKISLAVMDGKFTNVVPTGRDSIFTLVHIEESVHKRFVPKDGLVPRNIFELSKRSRAQKIIERSAEWFPILRKAKLIKTNFVLRGVNASREHDDSRTSDIAEHGFGCFSILGGKVDNSVALAKEVARLIAGTGLS